MMCQLAFFREQYVCLLANFFLTRKTATLKSFSTFYDLYSFAGDDDDGRCVDVVWWSKYSTRKTRTTFTGNLYPNRLSFLQIEHVTQFWIVGHPIEQTTLPNLCKLVSWLSVYAHILQHHRHCLHCVRKVQLWNLSKDAKI